MRDIKFKLLLAIDRAPNSKRYLKLFIKLLQLPLIFKFQPRYQKIDQRLNITEYPFDTNVFQGYFAKKIGFNDKVLYHKVTDVDCELYEFQSDTREKKLLTKTKYWNFQQGTMAEYASDGTVICNASLRDKQGVFAIGLNSLTKIQEGYIFQSVSSEDWICMVELCRVNNYRAEYGYVYKRENYLKPKNEVLVFYNLKLKKRWALGLIDITKFIDISSYKNFELNHFQFNKNSNDCVGLLRAYDDRGRCVSALFHINPDIGLVQKLIDFEIISHFTWVSEHKIVYWGTNKGANRCYWTVEINGDTGEVSYLNNLPDGHPVCISDGVFVTDTYPDKYGWITLYKCNLDGDIERLLKTSHPWELNASSRCDAHPKYHEFEEKLYLDVRLGAKRKILCVTGIT